VIGSKQSGLREENVVLQVDMLVEIVLEFFELPVREHEGIAGILWSSPFSKLMSVQLFHGRFW
jgi:hypothetical protein